MARRPKEVTNGVGFSFKGRLDTHKIHSSQDLYHFRLRYKIGTAPDAQWPHDVLYRVRLVFIEPHYYFLCTPVGKKSKDAKRKGTFSVQSEKDGTWTAMTLSPGVYLREFRMYAGSPPCTSTLVTVDIMEDGTLRVMRPDIVRTPKTADIPPGQSVLDPKPIKFGVKRVPLALPPPPANDDTSSDEEVPANPQTVSARLQQRVTTADGVITEFYSDGTVIETFPETFPNADEDT